MNLHFTATVSAGPAFTIAVKTDGTLWSWGTNQNGQLGIGSSGFGNQRTSPGQVGADTDWASASAGSTFTVARKTDGHLWAWGQNLSGQLGTGNTTQQTSPAPVGSATDWSFIETGTSYTIALKTDKTLWACGSNNVGQFGNGSTAFTVTSFVPAGFRSNPPYLPGLGGGAATLLLRTPCERTDAKGYYNFLHPTVSTRKLFAIHPQGNTGTFTVVYDSSRNTNTTPLLQSNTTGATSLMGRLVTVTYSGTIGAGVRVRFYYSQTDSANTSSSLNAWMSTRPGAIRKWQWIKYEGDAAATAANQTANGFSGSYTALMPDSSGVENGVRFVEFWNIMSFSTFGAIASATASSVNDPLAQCWKQVSLGWNHALALKEDGTLWAWGNRSAGALGTGNSGIGQEPVPIQVGTATDWAYISAGMHHSFAIKNDGSLWAWGNNTSGQLGIGSTATQVVPVRVGLENTWAKVFARADGTTTVALKTNGTLWAWGNNLNGQVGIGNTTQQNAPVQVGTDADWVSVGVGASHVIAVKANGTLWAWGSNQYGKLGIGNTTDQWTPVQVGTDTDWAQVQSGGSHSAAIKNNGAMWVWGLELGTGSLSTYQTTPVQVGTDVDWRTLVAGGGLMLAIKTNGTLWSWGGGNTGDGTASNRTTPAQIGTDNDWVAGTGGVSTVIALKSNKSLWGWGQSNQQQLGIANNATQVSPVPIGSSNYPAHLPGLGGGSTVLLPSCNADIKGYYSYRHPNAAWRKLFAIHPQGNEASFAVSYDTSRNTNSTPLLKNNATAASSLMGRLVTVTYGGTIGSGVRVRYYYSQADSTNTMKTLTSMRPDAILQWKWIKYEGDAVTMVSSQTPTGFSGSYTQLTPDSSGIENGVPFVEFWNITSFSTFGGLALADFSAVSPLTQCWKQVVAATSHTIAIKEDGTLWAWGGNEAGQLGIGNQTDQAVPIQVGTDTDWESVAVGWQHTMAIKTNGTLWAWGANQYAQLGFGSTSANVLTPTQVGTATDWASVVAAQTHTVALKKAGTLWTWGGNNYGQLGYTSSGLQAPMQVGGTDWARISVGYYHTLAIKTDGTLWAWGRNDNGQLGIGNTTNQWSPMQVGSANGWITVSGGMEHSVAIKADGTIWSSGRNIYGALGMGDNTDRSTLEQIGTATDWASVKTGATHTVARKTDGTIWAWGENTSGQVGDGTTTHRNNPLQIGTASDWTAITAGSFHTIAIKPNREIWVCGYNNRGQLGIGNTTNQSTMVSSGSSNYQAYLPSLGGSGSVTLIMPCGSADIRGYYNFVSPVNKKGRLFAVHPMENTGTLTITYDTSRNTNSSPLLLTDATGATSLMGRLVTVTYDGTISTGMRVRFYYSAADSTNASNALNSWVSAHPGTIKQWQWVKYEGDAATMASSQTAHGFSGTYTRLTPDSSGVENGVNFVEFWNITSFSTFGAVAFANSFNATLPITLSSFTARLQDNCSAVQLHWVTASEQNSKDFTVQRSANGTDWSNIGTVAAAGNSSAAKNYSYTDAAAKGSSAYYYRLQLNDLDGRKQHSTLVTVRMNCATGQYFVYPNPVRDHITVQSPTGGGQKVLAVYNATGQRVQQLILQPGTVQSISTARWNKGINMIIITENNKQVHAQTVIRQ